MNSGISMIVDMPSFERRPVFTTKGIASARRHLTDASLQAASRIEAFVEEPPLARHFTLDLGDNYVVTIYERLAPTTTNQQKPRWSNWAETCTASHSLFNILLNSVSSSSYCGFVISCLVLGARGDTTYTVR
jgi:hypothetical protein